MPTVYFVIPCYNEEAVLPETVKELTKVLEGMEEHGLADQKSRMLFVDDGSRDKTWELISKYHEENHWVSGLKLSHNRGHQNALLYGVKIVKELKDSASRLYTT